MIFTPLPFLLVPLACQTTTQFFRKQKPLPKPKLSRVTVRPCTESAICEYGRWIGTYDFPEVYNTGLLETKVSDFNATLYSQYLKIFRTKLFVISEYDKPGNLQLFNH